MAKQISKRVPRGWKRSTGPVTEKLGKVFEIAFGVWGPKIDDVIDWAAWTKRGQIRRIDVQNKAGEIYSWRDGNLVFSMSITASVSKESAGG